MEIKPKISQEFLKERFYYDCDRGIFTRAVRCGKYPVGSIATHLVKGYPMVSIDGRKYLAHRLAWLYHYGEFPDGEIDHFDRNPLNFAIANLRAVSHSQNMENVFAPNSNNRSGFRGVCFYPPTNRYMAYINVHGERKHLGYFKTKDEASRAYMTAKQELHLFANHK